MFLTYTDILSNTTNTSNISTLVQCQGCAKDENNVENRKKNDPDDMENDHSHDGDDDHYGWFQNYAFDGDPMSYQKLDSKKKVKIYFKKNISNLSLKSSFEIFHSL
ncbi:hypothetical protein QR98_0049840 [Sarcoptes scabiei]|uniref:Uncharacterized protein n=1 Tax=Sarcoptes scabiei TaxID=52283 RepID=A0A132A6E9_SARSC|nr:hypothetical protein QR98_0049840 [Sarcoptes scabiei]